ncbi:MAG: hypothetical protein QXL22_03050 [Candidatus Nezhaarchaeales archaeon]
MSKELMERVLLNTGLFWRPEKDLRYIFDLKSSGLETFLLAAYASRDSFYLCEDPDFIIMPVNEDDLWRLRQTSPVKCMTCSPFKKMRFNDYKGYILREEEPEIIPKVPEEFFYSMLKKEKYIILRILRLERNYPLRDMRDILGFTPEELYNEVRNIGIDPCDVAVMLINEPNPQREDWFDEYIAGMILRCDGYIVSTCFAPEQYLVGSDMYGFKFGYYGEGAFLLEILLGKDIRKGRTEASACIVEAEARNRVISDKHGLGQLHKYIVNSELSYGKGYISASLMDNYLIQEVLKHRYGVITFDYEGQIIAKDSEYHGCEKRENKLLEEAEKFIEELYHELSFLRSLY